MKEKVLIAYGIYLLLLSIITFFAYGIDKRKAVKNKWRTKEKTLLLMSFLGGAFGGTLGMKKFRHKTSREHWYFKVVNVLGILVHMALFVYVLFFVQF